MPQKTLKQMLLESKIFSRPIEMATDHLDDDAMRYLREGRSDRTVYVERHVTTAGIRYDVTALAAAADDAGVPACLRRIISGLMGCDRTGSAKYSLAFANDAPLCADLPTLSSRPAPDTFSPYFALLSMRHLDDDSVAYLEAVCDDRHRASPVRVCKLVQWGVTTRYVMTVDRLEVSMYHDVPGPVADVIGYMEDVYGTEPLRFPPVVFTKSVPPLKGPLGIYGRSR